MALSNTATPIYYGRFRDAVIRGEIPVCKEISMEMNRIDSWIENPGIWYDDQAILGFVSYCENELTLTDGENLHLSYGLNRYLVGITLSIEVFMSQERMDNPGTMRTAE